MNSVSLFNTKCWEKSYNGEWQLVLLAQQVLYLCSGCKTCSMTTGAGRKTSLKQLQFSLSLAMTDGPG